MTLARAAVMGCAALLVCAGSLRAATVFDPALRFRTIRTDHFVIYVHQGEERTGARLAVIAEETWRAMRQPLGVDPPHRTHVVLADETELANGYATPVPYDTIVIYATWPRGADFLGDADDWLRVAFTHEFTHIVHLDRSAGWARLARDVFGRVTVAFPNLFLPTWQIEGLAVYEESALTGQGRLHAGDFTAVVREAARAGAIEPLDRINGGLTDWPDGNAAYAYGVGFHEYLANRFGAASLGTLADATARRLPYLGSRAFRRVYGESLGDLWRDYRANVPEVSTPGPTTSSGATTTRQITHQGYLVSGPRFDRASPRDVLYASRTADEFPSLYRVNIDTRSSRRVATQYAGTTATAGHDAIYFDQLELRRNVGTYSDLYSMSRAGGRIAAITREARVLEPDLSPDETTIAAVQERSGHRDLVLVRVRSAAGVADAGAQSERPPVDVLMSEPDTQFDAPRWSPDGRRIAVERHRLGSLSEIVVIDVGTHGVHVVASFEGTRIVTPAWTPDGHAIVAAAAAENQPFNLVEFAVDGSAPPRPLTSLTGGATWPDVSPDGRTIVFAGYSVSGFDVFAIDFAAAAHVAAAHVDAGPAATQISQPVGDQLVGGQLVDPAPVTTTAYRPLATLAPTSWSPIIQTAPSQVRIGAAVAATDVLAYHVYSASATWLASGPANAPDAAAAQPDWQISYLYNRWRPTLFAAASTSTSFFAGPPADNGTPTNATLRERQLEIGTIVPFIHTRASHTALVSAVRSTDDYTFSDGILSRIRTATRGAWVTTTAHTYGYSISPEEGITAGATVEMVRRALGSSADATIATADVRGYLPGLAAHHVLALRAAAGVSTGDPTVGRTFLLGGSVTDLGAASFSSSAVSLLRGFPANTFAGRHAGVLNVDYRFPIARPQRGNGTWPLFLHTVHGAIVGDAGQAWTNTFRANAIKTSIGAELSANIVAGFVYPVTLSVGTAWGHDGAAVVGNRQTVYVRIGKAF